MARNVEIKAKVDDVEQILPRVEAITTSAPTTILQTDTFFTCATGRLKLREFGNGSGELIFYRRADTADPKESFYIRTSSPDPASLRQALSLAYGQVGTVRKERTLYFVGRTRVHVDRVDGLGNFLELEVVLAEGESLEDGIREAKRIATDLGISSDNFVKGAYIDLLSTGVFKSMNI